MEQWDDQQHQKQRSWANEMKTKKQENLTDVSPWAWGLVLAEHHISLIFSREERKIGANGFANGQSAHQLDS